MMQAGYCTLRQPLAAELQALYGSTPTRPRSTVRTLPDAIEVQLQPDGSAIIESILVSLDLLHQGRYYYGTHVGLTNASGRARVTRAEILDGFANDQRTFVMDYRVPLEECDAEAVIRVEGGQEFASRQAELLEASDHTLVAPEAYSQWKAARNEAILPTRVPVTLDRPDANGMVRAQIRVRSV
jgi:hypothetical protein